MAFEVLHLSTKYELGDEVPKRLVQTESVSNQIGDHKNEKKKKGKKK